jgi:hypothetical protein
VAGHLLGDLELTAIMQVVVIPVARKPWALI